MNARFQQDNEFSIPELMHGSHIPVGGYLCEKKTGCCDYRYVRIAGIRQNEDSMRLLLDGDRLNGRNYYPMRYDDVALIAFKRDFEVLHALHRKSR